MDINVKIKRMAAMAIFMAIIVLLQMIGGFIKFGPFSVSLVLVPIVVGAAVLGTRAGAVLGATFGVVVLINCIYGIDVGGNMLWLANPPLTAVLCLLKGTLCGLVAGLVYTAVSKRSKKGSLLPVVCAAVACPVTNTGLFLLAVIFLFRDTLIVWAGDTPVLYYALTGLAGVNFLIELLVNILLSPVIVRIIRASKDLFPASGKNGKP